MFCLLRVHQHVQLFIPDLALILSYNLIEKVWNCAMNLVCNCYFENKRSVCIIFLLFNLTDLLVTEKVFKTEFWSYNLETLEPPDFIPDTVKMFFFSIYTIIDLFIYFTVFILHSNVLTKMLTYQLRLMNLIPQKI